MTYTGTRPADRHMNRYADATDVSVVKFASKAPNAVPFYDIHLYGTKIRQIQLQGYYSLTAVLDDLHFLTGREWFVESMTGREIPADSNSRHSWNDGAYRSDFKLTDDI